MISKKTYKEYEPTSSFYELTQELTMDGTWFIVDGLCDDLSHDYHYHASRHGQKIHDPG